jgi:hypothetical protein
MYSLVVRISAKKKYYVNSTQTFHYIQRGRNHTGRPRQGWEFEVRKGR